MHASLSKRLTESPPDIPLKRATFAWHGLSRPTEAVCFNDQDLTSFHMYAARIKVDRPCPAGAPVVEPDAAPHRK